MKEIDQLEQAIAAIEAHRQTLGDAVVETALGPMREKLAALQANGHKLGEVPQRKQVTILFADVSGFTSMVEQIDHEEASGVMNTLWSRLDRTILDHGGFIDKHIGDAVMTLFGAPTAREDDPERAIHAALSILEEIKDWKGTFDGSTPLLRKMAGEIEMRIGINTGPVLLGNVGTTGEYSAIGDAVNLASRLEDAAPVGGILISRDTYRHVRGIFDVTPLEPIQVKGKNEPVQVYVVNGRRPRSFRITTRGVEGIETRTIGREAEMAKMKQVMQTVIERNQTHLLNVVAEAGTGKSRLLYEFIGWLEDQHISTRLFKGRATQEMTNTPYALIRDIFSTSFEIQDSDSGRTAREKLRRGILAFEAGISEAEAHVPFIGHLIGYDYSDHPRLQGIRGDARQVRDLAFHYVSQFFLNITRQQTAVILLEDIHWADSASLELLEHVMSTQPDLPLLMISLTRPSLFEDHDAWGSGPVEHVRLDLGPLSENDCRLLVAEILRNAPEIPPALVDLVIDRAEGSPFYVEELIKSLMDKGVIMRNGDDDPWRIDANRIPDLKVPGTLTGILQARLDNLPTREHETIQQASIVGRVFWKVVMDHMHKPESQVLEPPVIVAESLNALERKEFVFQHDASAFTDSPEYIFSNTMLQEVTYESVLLKSRRIYHVQAAEALIELSGERVNEYAGRIGEHFELAEEWTRAADWYTRAGIQAQDTFASEAAISYYQKALDYFKDNSGAEQIAHKQELYRRMGEVLNWLARYTEAVDIYQRSLDLAEETGDARARSVAYIGLATSLGYQGDHQASLENAIQAEKFALECDSQEYLVRALWTQGTAQFRLGESAAVLDLGEQALAIATQLEDREEIGRCLNLLGGAYYVTGRYDEAEDYFERALRIFEGLGNPRQGMDLSSNLGVIAEARGDHDTALERYQKALEIARNMGYRDGEIVFLTNRGGEYNAVKNYTKAEADLLEAVKLAGAAGSWVLALTYCNLALAYQGGDKPEEALNAALKGLALGQEDNAPEYIGIAWRALGMISAGTGEVITVGDAESGQTGSYSAVECFERGAKILQEAGLEGERARTLREWAAYELGAGDKEKGAALWETARDIFAGLGATMEVERMGILPGSSI
jgi:predicted ATPase/class 3 adenylate cyclase